MRNGRSEESGQAAIARIEAACEFHSPLKPINKNIRKEKDFQTLSC